LKPKVIKLTYTRKVTFNIIGTIIHFALKIPLNKNLTQLNTSSDEKYYTFTKTYDFYLFLLVIDKISLVKKIMLTFINHKLCIIKQVHNEFMHGLDIIMTTIFYQTLQD
jgi:hypothetical protein